MQSLQEADRIKEEQLLAEIRDLLKQRP